MGKPPPMALKISTLREALQRVARGLQKLSALTLGTGDLDYICKLTLKYHLNYYGTLCLITPLEKVSIKFQNQETPQLN